MLVVEDDDCDVEALTLGLTQEGFRVERAVDGVEAIERFEVLRPDVVLLDAILPRLSGLEVCRQLRTRSHVPIILAGRRDSEIDTVVGLELGADDYVTKPYRLHELAARMRAVMRRMTFAALNTAPLRVDDLVLQPAEHTLTLGGEPLYIPLKEFQLLHVLLLDAGKVVSREALLSRVWGDDYGHATNTLDVHIMRLRDRIEVDSASPTRILTIRGLGYKYSTRNDLIKAPGVGA